MRGEQSGRQAVARAASIACCVAVAALLAGCGGGGSDDSTNVLSAGQLNIQLPDGYKVKDGEVVRPASAKKSAPTGPSTAQQDTTETTIVSTKMDPTTEMFAALSKFRKCLDDAGVKFIGAPDQSNPDSPTNDPNYIQNLSTCAARSQIVQAMQAVQADNQNLTPAEIEERNKGYLRWRSCMIDRGWKIPKPTPDAEGKLFSIGGGGGNNNQPQIEPPPGKDLLSSKDLEECATKAQAKAKS